MNYYIENSCTDPFYNLALEQVIFDFCDPCHSYFMLWQNHNSIIIGRNQNTVSEINTAFINAHNINVARRLSGGGAVYHDMGNLNYTFITNTDGTAIDFSFFCQPVKNALVSFGVPAEITGRNDMTIQGKKISGNAQYIKKGRVMHHGTLLYDSDLDILSKALNTEADMIETKSIKSVKSRVTNIRPFMKNDLPLCIFIKDLKDYLYKDFNLKEYILTPSEEAEVEKAKKNVYSQWKWNYGASPPYNMQKKRKIKNCGTIEILLDIGKEGIIKDMVFYGDFFGNKETQELTGLFKGHRFEYNELENILRKTDISLFFHNLDAKTFLSLLFENHVTD